MMARQLKLRAMRLRRTTLILIGCALAASVFYGWYLQYQNNAAKSFLAQLRKNDHNRYLTELRKMNGFAAYLNAYRQSAKFVRFRALAPVFVQGRWTLRAEPKRLSVSQMAENCTDPITFEYGRLSLGNEGETAFQAQYRLQGQTLVVKTDSGPISVALISYGELLDHLELIPPGRKTAYYAYRCRM